MTNCFQLLVIEAVLFEFKDSLAIVFGSFENDIVKEPKINIDRWKLASISNISMHLIKKIMPIPIKLTSSKLSQMEINLDKRKLTWCGNYLVPPERGLGNRLAQYWFGRSLSFWLNLTFTKKSGCYCPADSKGKTWYFCDGYHMNISKFWTQFLPHTSNLTFHSLLNRIPNEYSIQIELEQNEKYIIEALDIYDLYQATFDKNDQEQYRFPHSQSYLSAAYAPCSLTLCGKKYIMHLIYIFIKDSKVRR